MRIGRVIFFCFFLLQAWYADAQVFDTLKTIPSKNRAAQALSIYKANYRHIDSAIAFKKIDELTRIAAELNDKALALAVFDCKADYYSVNYGFNPQSLYYYQKAIDQAIAEGLAVETGIYVFKKGQYYNTFEMYVPACQLYLKAYDIFKTAGPENVPGYVYNLNRIADFYYALGDLESSRRFLLEALGSRDVPPRDEINMINTVGLIYRSTGKYDDALRYFNTALKLANKNKDSVWLAIATGNIGSVYFMQKKYDTALPYIKTDYGQSVKFGEKINGAIALVRIATINADRKDYAIALKQIDTAEKIFSTHSKSTLKYRIDMYGLKAAIFETMNKPTEALRYRKIYDAASDSLAHINDVLSVERTKLKWENDKQQLKVQQLSARARTERIKRDALAGVLFLLIVISFLIYNRQKLIIRRDKAVLEKQEVALQLETSRADAEHNSAKLALIDFTDQLRVKNDIIESFKAELDMMQRQTDPLYMYRANQLTDMMNAHIMTDKSWHEFKTLFEKVHPSFFTILTVRFPDFTETDTRLLSLVKLKLNNREMAGMLGITVEGVKKSKQRLRKKIGLTEENSLEALIAEI